VAIGVVSVAVLFVGWWWLASGLRGTSETGADSTMSAPASLGPMADSGEAGAEAAPSIPPAEAAAAAEGTPPLPYSVLIASYAARSDAEDRLGRLLQSEGGMYFVVPTVVRGALYHRVFAGAEPDVATARALMTELVASGRKDDASAWHLRPARLAYLLGVFGSRTEAEGRMQEAVTAGIPAYILSTAVEEGLGIDSVFQLYAGAYESPVAARAMIALLESAGEDPPLVDRRGRRH
jgi:cell division septation protein DedD